MQIPNKVLLLIIIVSIGAGIALEKQLIAVNKETDTSTVNNDVVTVIKEKKNKDGTSETDTTITDHSKTEDKKIQVIASEPPNWFVQGGVGLDTGLTQIYTLSINRRILGPIFVGVWGSTQKSAGVSVALQF